MTSTGENHIVNCSMGPLVATLCVLALAGCKEDEAEITQSKILDLPAPTPAMVIDGTAENDLLVGSDDSETLNGLGGDDTIIGAGGSDVLNGGDGDDLLIGDKKIGVQTTEGPVESEFLDGVVAFRGIPFAAPPIDDLRWAPPAPPALRTEILEATSFRDSCFQPGNDIGFDHADQMSEDCLYLNIWTPRPFFSDLPVMVWIHGGGNTNGGARDPLYDGASFAREGGVVLVSINYRLGPMGYLAHPQLSAESASGTSGNYGQLDIIAALQWVQDNISWFGGDPRNVTIFGESAGGVNTCNMMASPLAASLFHRAIIQSGVCIENQQVLDQSTDRHPESAEALGTRASVALGCDTAPDEIACLRAISPSALYETLDPAATNLDSGDSYGPITDGYVMTDAPLTVITANAHNRVPVMIGSNADEGATFRSSIRALITSVMAYEFILESIYDDDPDVVLNGPSADVLALYPASTEKEAEAAFEDLYGDTNFVCTARRAARRFAANGQSVWQYHFARVPPLLADLGAFHGAEIAYAFFNLDGVAYTADDDALGGAMQSYWTNFARKGNPNGSDLVTWPLYQAGTDRHLRLDTPVVEGTGLKQAECDLFDSL